AFKDICEKDRTSEDLFTKRVILLVEIAHTHLLLYIHQIDKFPKKIKKLYDIGKWLNYEL
ncbi:hypothetical protein, partial [Traorella massiliensis]|uniref:hypothetical protein n=1 Tax=Traorella massiliensis TaxID=1903263 RepID=UPI00248E4A4A